MERIFSLLLVISLLASPASGQQSWPLVYIDAPELIPDVDGTFELDKRIGNLEKRGEEFAAAINDAIAKKNTPVAVTHEPAAQWRIESVVREENDTYASLKASVRGEKAKPTQFVYKFAVVNIETGETVFNYNISKLFGPNSIRGFQEATEDFAGNFKKHLEPKKKK